ncbi:hypothetical protein [Aurantimonas sp. C2-3-R2]|nr:hypothetical protein [Aurantimonas sp. C2-4-R8]
MKFVSKAIAQQPKSKSTIPTMKTMTKAIEGMGKKVGAYEMRADGAVRVLVADPADNAATAKANPWDEVLNNGTS